MREYKIRREGAAAPEGTLSLPTVAPSAAICFSLPASPSPHRGALRRWIWASSSSRLDPARCLVLSVHGHGEAAAGGVGRPGEGKHRRGRAEGDVQGVEEDVQAALPAKT